MKGPTLLLSFLIASKVAYSEAIILVLVSTLLFLGLVLSTVEDPWSIPASASVDL